MRALVSMVVVGLAAPALAQDAFFQGEVVDAVAVPSLPKTTGDAAWAKATPRTFSLTAQRSVRLHDLKANALVTQDPRIEVQVRSLSAPEGIAVLLDWPDAAREGVRLDEPDSFADSVALEVPQKYGAGLRLPAISMGDEGAPVNVTLLRAAEKGTLESRFIAAGFGSLTRQIPASPSEAMTYDSAAKRWKAIFVLKGLEAKGLVPMAFAAWDGGRRERAGYKRISSWHFVRVPGQQVDAAWLAEMSFGYHPGDLGDPAKGKALAETICVACHDLPGKALAPRGVAPSLEGVGAYATPGYLRDSIVTPSLVIVHEPNPNQHYTPSAPRDANGAAPNADAFLWSSVGADGKRVSKMPVFSNFSKEQVADLVAFLKTIDGREAR